MVSVWYKPVETLISRVCKELKDLQANPADFGYFNTIGLPLERVAGEFTGFQSIHSYLFVYLLIY